MPLLIIHEDFFRSLFFTHEEFCPDLFGILLAFETELRGIDDYLKQTISRKIYLLAKEMDEEGRRWDSPGRKVGQQLAGSLSATDISFRQQAWAACPILGSECMGDNRGFGVQRNHSAVSRPIMMFAVSSRGCRYIIGKCSKQSTG